MGTEQPDHVFAFPVDYSFILLYDVGKDFSRTCHYAAALRVVSSAIDALSVSKRASKRLCSLLICKVAQELRKQVGIVAFPEVPAP